MCINPDYELRSIAGENVVVRQGKGPSDLTKIISLNESAALLYEALKGRDFSLEDAAAVLVEHYGLQEEKARADASAWADSMKACSLLDA